MGGPSAGSPSSRPMRKVPPGTRTITAPSRSETICVGQPEAWIGARASRGSRGERLDRDRRRGRGGDRPGRRRGGPTGFGRRGGGRAGAGRSARAAAGGTVAADLAPAAGGFGPVAWSGTSAPKSGSFRRWRSIACIASRAAAVPGRSWRPSRGGRRPTSVWPALSACRAFSTRFRPRPRAFGRRLGRRAWVSTTSGGCSLLARPGRPGATRIRAISPTRRGRRR